MQEAIISYFSQFPKEWAVFFLSMLPITELRATIPLAITQFQMPPVIAFLYAVSGNAFMGVIVVLIVEPVVKYFVEKFTPIHNFWQRYINRIYIKHEKNFEKWGALALIAFIAIPLPMTGAFTGAVAASVFGVPFKKAAPVILAGCVVAGIIVIGITLFIQGVI
jgi:uncharacterized membrane protein